MIKLTWAGRPVDWFRASHALGNWSHSGVAGKKSGWRQRRSYLRERRISERSFAASKSGPVSEWRVNRTGHLIDFGIAVERGALKISELPDDSGERGRPAGRMHC